MMITGIKPYSPIRRAQSFGKKKSDVSDYKLAEDTIKDIKNQIVVIDKKIASIKDHYFENPQKVIDDLQNAKSELKTRLTKWEKILSDLEKKLGIE